MLIDQRLGKGRRGRIGPTVWELDGPMPTFEEIENTDSHAKPLQQME